MKLVFSVLIDVRVHTSRGRPYTFFDKIKIERKGEIELEIIKKKIANLVSKKQHKNRVLLWTVYILLLFILKIDLIVTLIL